MRGLRTVTGAVVTLALGLGLAGCGSQRPTDDPAAGPTKGPVRPAAQARPRGTAPKIDAKDLEAKRLEKIWDIYIDDTIRDVWLVEGTAYVYSGTNRLWAIGLHDGLPKWQYHIPEGMSFAPGVYSYTDEGVQQIDELFLVSHDVLHVLDREHGYLLWKLKLPFSCASSPSGNYSHVYVGSWDDRIYAISKERRAIDWSYRTHAPVTAAATVTERQVESVFVGSEDGNVYSLNPVFEDRKWHHSTQDAVTGSPFFFRSYVYVTSRDMFVYCVRGVDGTVEWKYATGSPISRAAFAYDRETLYAVTDDHRLLTMNLQPLVAKSYLRWERPQVDRLLAQGKDGIYVLDRNGDIQKLDEKTGDSRWQTPLRVDAPFYAFNGMSVTDRTPERRNLSSTVVFGFEDGWLVALKEKGEY